MNTNKKTRVAIVASICLMIFLACLQDTIHAAESISSGQENIQNALYIEFTYQNTGKTVNVNGVNVQSVKLSGFILKNTETNQEIKYKKLIIDGRAVIGSRVYAEPGISGMNVVEFSFNNGKYIKFSAPMKGAISKKYALKNGTLTLW
ncbi:MAG: hypothetical protein LBI87_01755 [Candidatus Accumulibacter sp.]|jgi:hypothetical protein|nr:hypothetical protein [Accumulibacter sp.]